MAGMPSHRGRVLPALRPASKNGVVAERCHWGPCEAGGWILPGAHVRRHPEHGEPYHPGCFAAMEYANREGIA